MNYDGRLYTQAEVDDLIRSLHSLIEASKLINLEYNGRSDSKNCSVQEQLLEALDKFEKTKTYRR